MIVFTVLGTPTGKGRPRACRRGNHIAMYTPSKTEDAERSFLAQALPYKPATPLTGPLMVAIAATCPIPASWSKKKQDEARAGMIRPTGKPDIDNLVKLIFDALNGVFFADDKQITEVAASKVYGDVPSTVVRIHELG